MKVILKLSLFAATLFLTGVQVFILNTYSTSGEKLTRLQKEVSVVESENIVLSQKIASESAIANISSKASLLGLVHSAVPLSLSPHLPLAQGKDIRL